MKTKIALFALAVLVAALVAISCKKNDPSLEKNYSATPTLPATPDNYSSSTNDNAATLGRVLFYDKKLSLNNSVACGSCHQQERAFCDNQQFSTGLTSGKTARNTPSLFAKNSRMFWDGRAGSLRALVLRPIQNHVEMRFENLQALASKIAGIDYYEPLFKKAFGAAAKMDTSEIQLALTEFLKNFDFSQNKFSQSRKGLAALNASERLGELVFFGKGKCFNCHHIENPFSFPDDSLANGYGFTDESHNIGLDLVYSDNGVGGITNNPSEDGSFMIPVLLNVEFTAPYMHDGRFKTLEEVVEHYNSGIQNNPNLDEVLRDMDDFNSMNVAEILKKYDSNHDGEIEESEIAGIPPVKLGLTTAEKRGLVDFLKTLSDPTIYTEKKFSNPFTMK